MASLLGKSINDIKAAVTKHGGLAMQNRFAVYMQPPAASLLNLDIQGAITSAISGNFSIKNAFNDPRDISLLCESCSLPGRQITTMDYQSIRQAIKMPNGYINEDITFSFHLTHDYYIKKMFDKWVSAVIDFKNYRVRYQNEYTTDVIIQQLDKKNVPIYGIKLYKAFPVTINSINLDNTAENTPQKVSVTMAYEDYAVEGGLSSALSAIKTSIGGITNLV